VGVASGVDIFRNVGNPARNPLNAWHVNVFAWDNFWLHSWYKNVKENLKTENGLEI